MLARLLTILMGVRAAETVQARVPLHFGKRQCQLLCNVLPAWPYLLMR